MLALPASSDNLDAADMVGMGRVQEMMQRVEGPLGCAAMQIQRAHTG